MNLVTSWRDQFSTIGRTSIWLGSLTVLVATLALFTQFLLWVETRPGVVLDDPVVRLLPPKDFTWLTFAIIYMGLILAIVKLLRDPARLLLAIHAYTLLVWVRVLMMYSVPLDPPVGLIVLQDPLVQLTGDGNAPTRDLFFSGHTATLVLLALVVREKVWKGVFVASAVCVAALVLWQHVHYTIDVLVAPFVSYGAYRLATRLPFAPGGSS